MRFANPYFLLMLLIIPVLAFYAWTWRLRSFARLNFSSFRLFPEGATERRPISLLLLSGLRLLAIFLLIIALARPQKGQSREEAILPTRDIILCLDTSGSMEALDFNPRNRLDAAKEVIRQFIQNRKHDRIGLVVFSGRAFAQCPLTLDYDALLEFLDHVRIGMIKPDGTAIGTALATSASRLSKSTAKSKLVILLTDGRNNRGEIDPVTAAKASAALGIKIHAIGAGKPGGALFPVQDPFGGTRYVQLPEELDEVALREIAEVAHGRYFRATDLKSLKEIYEEINRMEKTEVSVQSFAEYDDLYFPLLLAAFLIFCTEIFLAQTWLRHFP